MRGTYRRGGRAWLGAALVLGLATAYGVGTAAPAYASNGNAYLEFDPSIGAWSLHVVAAPGVTNNIMVTQVPGNPGEPDGFTITDSGGPVTAGAFCQNIALGVFCPSAGVSKGYVDGGDLNDILGVRGTIDFVVHGGLGNDTIRTGGANDTLYGDDGGDTLIGDATSDLLIGGPGPDFMSGGGGTDTVSYAGVVQPIKADPDGYRGDDGATGEGDSIMIDVENIVGGLGPDILVGNGGPNVLNGGPGADTLVGNDGDDQLYGESGFDFLYGDGASLPAGPLAAGTLTAGIDVPAISHDVCSVGPDGGRTVDCEVLR